jgi:hypothetical protein
MRRSDGTFCPYIKEDCITFGCKFFQKLRGVDSNTGEDVDEYDCAILWNNVLLIENSQMQRQTGAAVESFRNEMKKDNNLLLNTYIYQDEP